MLLFSLLPAIGKKILKQMGSFYFVLRCFFLSRNAKNQKEVVIGKRDKKFPLFFSHLFFISLLRGESLIKYEILEKSRPGMVIVNERENSHFSG